MTIAATIALFSAALAVYVALLSARFSRAPGWQDQRYFSLAAIAIAGYSALNVPTTMALSERAVVWTSRVQLLLAAIHCVGWIRYSRVWVGARAGRGERVLVGLLLAVGIAALTPLYYPGGFVESHVPYLHLTYRNPVTSDVGTVAIAIVVGTLLLPLARFYRGWRSGTPHAGLQFLALAFLVAMAVNDAFVVENLSPLPYMIDFGYLVPVAAVAYALTSRFVEDARALAVLRGRLETEVAQRTSELTQAQEQLHRAEKLASLGQFAAGVAHEVNNPAAVVSANLAYLEQNEGDDLSEEGRQAIHESIVSMQRIAVIVRQLLDSGRLAASNEPPVSVSLRAMADDALRVARAKYGRRARLVNDVPAGLHASAQEGLLLQVIVNLVVNAVQAIPDGRTDGRVTLRGERDGLRARITVEDNGTGMSPDVLRRVFEPFFTTKPFGSGTGLGLAVSRGLVAGLGGDLRLESTYGEGTRATVELALAAAPARAEAASASPAEDAQRPRLLVVDDDPPLRSSLKRLLEPRYRVEVAGSVEEALERASTTELDLVLCDVMMPGGGGERFWRALSGKKPALAQRVVFFTGGATTEEAQSFLKDQPQPVLPKPLDIEQLARVSEQVARAAPRCALRLVHDTAALI